MKITILYDNETGEKKLRPSWGFSCLVEKGNEKILFDTGGTGRLLIHNINQLNIQPKGITGIFISHDHWDHRDGLPCFLNLLDKPVPIYLPESMKDKIKKEVGNSAEVIGISNSKKIIEGFYSTGEMNEGVKEQSLIVESKKGNVIVCGCSHPGLENIIEKAKEFGKVYGVIGGFHGFDKFETLKEIELIVPCHCTQFKEEIEKLYPKKTKKGGVGKVFEI